jgi:tyrosinase
MMVLYRNVDRLFAIWQALNPTSYTINQPAGDGTFVINASSIETDTTPLAPFNDASGQTYWTSDGVRNTQTFNYAYPETQRWAFSSDSDYMNSVQNYVNQLYGGVANQLATDTATNGDNSVAIPVSTPTGLAINGKASNSSARGITNGAAQKAMAATPASKAQKSGFNPIRSVLEIAKNAISGKSSSGGDGINGTRDPDHEAEIGKGNGTALTKLS